MHLQISFSVGMHNRKVIGDDVISDVYNWEEFEFLRSVVKEYLISNVLSFFLYGNFPSFLCKRTCQVSFTQRPKTSWVLNPRQKFWTKVSINISNWTVASSFSQHPSVSTAYRSLLAGILPQPSPNFLDQVIPWTFLLPDLLTPI